MFKPEAFDLEGRAPDSPLKPEEMAELARIADSLEMVVRLIRTSRVVEDLELIDLAIDAIEKADDEEEEERDPDRKLCRCGRWKMDHFEKESGLFIGDQWNCGAYEEELFWTPKLC